MYTIAPSAAPEGNAFWILSSTIEALKETGNEDLVQSYLAKARSKDYAHLRMVTEAYLSICNLSCQK